MSARNLYAQETLIDSLIVEQQALTAVEKFSSLHEQGRVQERYSALLPARGPSADEQYAFEVNLDSCTGCKSCVAACHSLNGLDEGEAFRDVGVLLGKDYIQTVTTACHHCEDPACTNGCPVRAYYKDPVTGIVRHLDDQCIGCQYCMWMCPYDVPKYNARLGIVRKCDMCAQRLSVGEAPACVQACPNGAITITLRKTNSIAEPRPSLGSMIPGAADSRITLPTTAYVSKRVLPYDANAADAQALGVQHAHSPLVVMLVLTQLAAGWFCTGFPLLGFLALSVGLLSSVAHLGRPREAWRFFLGLRRSWMSREILAFALLASLASGLLAWRWWHGSIPIPALVALAALSLVAVFASAMIYIKTRRAWWNARRTLLSFFGTVAMLGASGAAAVRAGAHDVRVFGAAALCFGLVLWFVEPRLRTSSPLSIRLLEGPLIRWSKTQRVSAAVALALQAVALLLPMWAWVLAPLACFVTLASCVCERVLFFRAVDAPKMPGGLAA